MIVTCNFTCCEYSFKSRLLKVLIAGILERSIDFGMKVLYFILYYLRILETGLVKNISALLLDKWVCRVAHLVKFALFNHEGSIINKQVGYSEVKYVRARISLQTAR